MNIQPTSLFAYRTEVEPTLPFRQKLIFDEIARHEDVTNTEISHYLGIPINTVTPRVNELRKLGLVCESVKRECQITHRKVIAWKIAITPLFTPVTPVSTP